MFVQTFYNLYLDGLITQSVLKYGLRSQHMNILHSIFILHWFRKVAVHLQKVLEVVSTSVYAGLNTLNCICKHFPRISYWDVSYEPSYCSFLLIKRAWAITTKPTYRSLSAQRLSDSTVLLTQRNVVKTDSFGYGRFRLIHVLVAKLNMLWAVEVFRWTQNSVLSGFRLRQFCLTTSMQSVFGSGF
jgi:hypothetical protein